MTETTPAPTSLHNIREWITVKDHEVFVHKVIEQEIILHEISKRIIYVEVECRNHSSTENLRCGRNQWRIYARDGYSFEALSEVNGQVFYSQERRYFGGDRFINPGRNVRGWLAFNVPYESRLEYLQFVSALIGTRTADIDLAHVIEIERTRDLDRSEGPAPGAPQA